MLGERWLGAQILASDRTMGFDPSVSLVQRTRPDLFSADRYFWKEGSEKLQVLDSWGWG